MRLACALLLLAAIAAADEVSQRLWVVRVTTERATSLGTNRQTLAAPALPVGGKGLLLAVGFSLDPPEGDGDEAVSIRARTPDGREVPATLLGGVDELECTFFRVADAPEPFAVPAAPVALSPGDRVVLWGRHGERMGYAPRKAEAHVDAVVDRPQHLYALREPLRTWIGCVATTPDGRLVGFVDTRSTVFEGEGLMVGVGRETLVVVSAPVYLDAIRRPPEREGPARGRAWIGINLSPFDADREAYFGVEGDWKGALVTGVSPGSPADKAGIEVHDVIQKLGTFVVRFESREEWDGLLRAVQRQPLGRPLPCRVVRFTERQDGTFAHERLDLEIALEERPVGFSDAPETEVASIGVKVKPITHDFRRNAKLPAGLTGVVVTRTARASPARLGGLRPSDVILEVDRAPVTGVAQFAELVRAARAGGRPRIVLFVRRGSETLFVAIPTED